MVLRAAAAQDYPRLKYKQAHTILPGQENWEKFVRWSAVEDLELALVALTGGDPACEHCHGEVPPLPPNLPERCPACGHRA